MAPIILRPDLHAVASLIPQHVKLLDIGSGNGELLEYLHRLKHVDARGIELTQEGVSQCISRGVLCVQGDADKDLPFYPDNCFDYVVSCNTLQACENPKIVLTEMLRIARHVVVSLPNFGYIRNRLYLLTKGKMPVTESLSYEWYETPNIHFCTAKDFIQMCESVNAIVERQLYLSSKGNIVLPFFGNLLGDTAIFLLRRP